MANRTGEQFDWQDLAGAIPGAVAIQSGSEFVYVSEAFATAVECDADSLEGGCWRKAFEFEEGGHRVDDAFATARREGRWTGPVRLASETADAESVDTGGDTTDSELGLMLSAAGDGALLWVLTEQVPDEGTPNRDMLSDKRTYSNDRLRNRPTVVQAMLDAVDDVVYAIDDDGAMYFCNQALVERTGYERDQIYGMHPKELIPEDHHEYVPGLMESIDAIEDRRVDVDILTRGGERLTHEFQGVTVEVPETGETFRCGFARDVTEQRRLERERKRRMDELTILDQVNDILLEISDHLIQRTSQAAVKQVVCDHLASATLYQFAVIVDATVDSDKTTPRVSAGDVPPDIGTVDSLVTRAIHTTETQIASVGDLGFDASSEVDVEAVATIPLCHDGAVNGVLVIGAPRDNAFTQREQAALSVLGRTVGVAIYAARHRNLLFSDTVEQLEFRVDDADAVLFVPVRAISCTLTLDSYVAAGDDWILYVDIDDAPPAAVVEELASDNRVETARVVGDARVEVVAESPTLDVVTGAGAAVHDATLTPTGGRIIINAPLGVRVRNLIETLQRRYPGATLYGREKREKEIATVGRPDGLLDTLTDRQRDAMEAAYRSGYFSWPRDSTAEEIANLLGVSPSTLHAHLRKAEERILAELFDDG